MTVLSQFQSFATISVCHHPPNIDRLLAFKKSSFYKVLEPLVTFITTSSPPSTLNESRFIDAAEVADTQIRLLKNSHASLYYNYLAVTQASGLLGLHNDVDVDLGSTLKMLGLPRPLRRAELSLSLKHVYALAHFLAYSPAAFLVILEDDSIPSEDSHFQLLSVLHYCSSSLPSGAPLFIDVGGGLNMRSPYTTKSLTVPLANGQLSVIKLTVPPHHTTRTTCGYIVNKEFVAQYLLKRLPVVLPSDLLIFASMDGMHGLQTLWMEPPLFRHGSQDGSFQSTVQPTNKGGSGQPAP